MPPTLALLLLSAEGRDDAPPIERALPWLDGLHQAVVAALDGRLAEAAELTGRGLDGEVLKGHRHVHWIPRADEAGLARHVLAWCPGGFGPVALEVLARRFRIFLGPHKPVAIAEPELLGLGADAPIRLMDSVPGVAAVWTSAHPFLLARHPKAHRDTLDEQVRKELIQRGFPEPSSIRAEPWRDGLDWSFRRGHDARAPASRAMRVSIEFATPVTGPLCLGYQSHFGLGLFVPERSS